MGRLLPLGPRELPRADPRRGGPLGRVERLRIRRPSGTARPSGHPALAPPRPEARAGDGDPRPPERRPPRPRGRARKRRGTTSSSRSARWSTRASGRGSSTTGSSGWPGSGEASSSPSRSSGRGSPSGSPAGGRTGRRSGGPRAGTGSSRSTSPGRTRWPRSPPRSGRCAEQRERPVRPRRREPAGDGPRALGRRGRDLVPGRASAEQSREAEVRDGDRRGAALARLGLAPARSRGPAVRTSARTPSGSRCRRRGASSPARSRAAPKGRLERPLRSGVSPSPARTCSRGYVTRIEPRRTQTGIRSSGAGRDRVAAARDRLARPEVDPLAARQVDPALAGALLQDRRHPERRAEPVGVVDLPAARVAGVDQAQRPRDRQPGARGASAAALRMYGTRRSWSSTRSR